MEDLFDQADYLLFESRDFVAAQDIYKLILELEPQNVDAITSMAYCIKFAAASTQDPLPDTLFNDLNKLYRQALAIEVNDIEANFNLGMLYLEFNKDM